jgi:hypothetical protein
LNIQKNAAVSRHAATSEFPRFLRPSAFQARSSFVFFDFGAAGVFFGQLHHFVELRFAAEVIVIDRFKFGD